jgi:hypothetical protein
MLCVAFTPPPLGAQQGWATKPNADRVLLDEGVVKQKIDILNNKKPIHGIKLNGWIHLIHGRLREETVTNEISSAYRLTWELTHTFCDLA